MGVQTEPTNIIPWDGLWIDCEEECERIARRIRQHLRDKLKRRGVVIALSGGIDSAVVGTLCVQALGSQRVFGLLLPEKDSSAETRRLSRLVVDHLGIQAERRDITDILETLGCYRSRDEAIATVLPQYNAGYRCKLVLPSLLEVDRLRLFSLIVESPDGEQTRVRLPLKTYSQIVAATGFKNRVRRTLEYFHADRLHYAVAGSRNLLEYDQGFFVKQGTGTADVEPIGHLYKTQVYQLAEYLELPGEICDRAPTADVYSMPQDQEEFYFSAPHHVLDMCLHGKNRGMTPEEMAPVLALEVQQVERIYKDIEAKRSAACYQHVPPFLVERVESVPLPTS